MYQLSVHQNKHTKYELHIIFPLGRNNEKIASQKVKTAINQSIIELSSIFPPLHLYPTYFYFLRPRNHFGIRLIRIESGRPI